MVTTLRRAVGFGVFAAAAWAAATVSQAEDGPQYNKSWIWVDPSNGGKPLAAGDAWEIPVEYFLDASEDKGGTTLALCGLGPWIDCPDGKYETKRHHVGFAKGIFGQIPVKPGKGRYVFNATVPPALPQVRKNNRVLLIANFRNSAGKDWPWQVRANNSFVRKSGFFELESEKPGNLFLYQEPVCLVAKVKNVKDAGQEKSLSYAVHDVGGREVAKGEVRFKVEKDGQEVRIPLEVRTRGTFVLEAEVAGWEKRITNFARIPDVLAVTKGAPTPFGMTNALGEDECRIAQRLGLTFCRRFTDWYRLQPGPDVYKLEEVEKELATARKCGIETWICIVSPPAWALEGPGRNIGYNAFKGKWDAWREFVKTATERYKGKMFGWEWLNEITPGGSENYVEDYLTLCRLGTETVRAVDPSMKIQLAGGLWPRSFRTSVLAAGGGKYVDILPIHYSNGGAALEARADLDAAGCANVAVWDNESARGINAWGVPPLEELANVQQANWVLTQWVDELAAGCERIVYFGGDGDAAGNWTYLLDDRSPRPVAATLAVLSAKMSGARPLGVFALGKSGLFHLFDRGGKPLVVCSASEKPETVPLHVGTEKVRATDYQGNESELAAPKGKVELPLAEVRYFLEDADLDVLKAYVVPTVLASKAALKRSKLVETPRVSLLKGRPGEVCVQIRNLYDRELAGKMLPQLPDGWPAAPVPFSLKAGEEKVFTVPLTAPENAEAKDLDAKIAFEFAWDKLPRIEKPLVLSVISSDMLGNLLPNGDFETPNADGAGPEGWGVNGKTKSWVPSEGLGDGLGKHVLKFTNTNKNWESCGRTIGLRGGQTYLYTAWIWNQKMSAGSNIYQNLTDGKTVPMYDVQVFTAGSDNPYWQVFTCRYKAPENLKSVGFSPVVNGEGWALYDNLRVTIFQGTDYAAECHRAKTPPKMDGDLGEWATRCPIPLIGKNQLTVLDKSCAWTPQNLSGVAYLMWDDANLYFALKVRDDVHQPLTGEETAQGDGVVLAFDPANRAPGAEAKAFAYHVSAATPGGGSGKHTIYRPKERSGGLQSGHLFKDSSIYELAVAKGEGTCTYEMRIPFGELNGIRPGVGSRFAFSIQLNDNDGKGPVARMSWGGGVSPNWKPSDFGVVTIVE